MSKYETSAGYVTRADAFAKFCHLIREAEDQAYVISHLTAQNPATKMNFSQLAGVASANSSPASTTKSSNSAKGG